MIEPRTATECLSLCELPLAWADRLLERYAPPSCKRVYIGSSFCPQAFLLATAERVRRLADRCREGGMALTLVLPIVPQGLLRQVEERAAELVEQAEGTIDEVTVNDYGAFMKWGSIAQESGGKLHLNLGRLIGKDTRDPRDPDYPHIPYRPQLLQADAWGGTHLDRLLQTQPIAGLELDPTHALLDLSSLPAGIEPALYGPLCYQSTGQICEFASIGLLEEEKFRPNAPCKRQCLRNAIRYTGASGVEYCKLGRTMWFDPDWRTQVVGVPSLRRVNAPLLEVLG